MNSIGLLQPLVALLVLSSVMWAWLYATRIPAMSKYKVELNPTLTTDELSSQLPHNVRWKADNYNHLMEQPTLFYAVVLTLALLGEANSINVALAWGYVGLRTAHSVVQAVWNNIMLRFVLFSVASLALIALITRAVMIVF